LADVLLTHSYHLPYDPKQVRKMQPYAPLGTLFAAAALQQNGHSVAVFDSMLREPDAAFAEMLAVHRPKIVAVYEDDFNFLSKMCLSRMREVAWKIASAAREATAMTVVHGSDSTDNPELFLENGFDFVLCGEAEESLTRLCNAALRGLPVPDLDGLARLDRNRRVVLSSQRLAKNAAWADLPRPPRELIDLSPYRTAWLEAHGYFSANMVASRGCPYHCSWCAKPISGNKFHLRSPADVAEEMRLLKHRDGAQHIWFGDDVFALDHRWVETFVEEVNQRDAVVPFKIQSRADLMTDSTVRNLKAAGCAEVWMGVESGSQSVLNAMEKGLRISSVRSARSRLRQSGIRACYFLQFGYPGEGWAELHQTISLVRETRPDDIGISFSYPLPGTKFYDQVKAQLGRKRNWTDSDDLCIMFKAAYTTDFYRAVRDALHAEVDSWRDSAPRTDARADIENMWRQVDQLEPVCRQPDASVASQGIGLLSPTQIMPAPRLVRPTEA
jgi:anaerobic magnesium-protoporphyrin IX monomethyl ester cyclase